MHPVTVLLFSYLSRQREGFKEDWANANFVNSHDVADVYQNAGAISACSVLKQIIEIEADDLFEEAE